MFVATDGGEHLRDGYTPAVQAHLIEHIAVNTEGKGLAHIAVIERRATDIEVNQRLTSRRRGGGLDIRAKGLDRLGGKVVEHIYITRLQREDAGIRVRDILYRDLGDSGNARPVILERFEVELVVYHELGRPVRPRHQ